jgi:nucleoside-diphosphate-sugar epimerase
MEKIKVQSEDINEIITDASIPWEKLRHCHILITGATGMVGGMLVRTLAEANRQYDFDAQIIGQGRKESVLYELEKVYQIKTISGDICDPALFEIAPSQADYIIHCASVTRSKEMIERPVDVMTTSLYGTKNILELGKKLGCSSMVYLSSMEIYGQIQKVEVTEKDLGYLALSNPRSSYPESKRACEAMCHSYVQQYHLPIKIARLAQTFGAGTDQMDTRVFAQFARSAMNHETIILHTQGASRGNYCYLADTVRALLLILLKGQDGETYNIASQTATIREMAELVAKEYHVNIALPISDKVLEGNYGYAPTTSYKLNTDKIESLGWRAKHCLLESYQRMIEDWHQIELVSRLNEIIT